MRDEVSVTQLEAPVGFAAVPQQGSHRIMPKRWG